jgi:hypothetical protein
MAASNTRFTQNSLGQSKNPIDSDHGIYRYKVAESYCLGAHGRHGHLQPLMPEDCWIRSIAVQVIASVLLLQTLTVVWAEEAAIPSDHKFVDELVSELGFQPSDLIERVRQLANMVG